MKSVNCEENACGRCLRNAGEIDYMFSMILLMVHAMAMAIISDGMVTLEASEHIFIEHRMGSDHKLSTVLPV